jgi:AcrR family transcriptional regulator
MVREATVRKRQKRSLLTEERLAAAVIDELSESGLEGCTVPAVAERAGVAVGTIYRRYANKDALVAEAILNLVSLGEGARRGDYAALTIEALDLRDCLSRIARAAVRIASENRTLLLAIRSFARTRADPVWRKKFQELQGLGRDSVVRAAMARFGPEIRGGESALRLSLAALYGAVEVIWLEPQAGLFNKPLTQEEFIEGLTRMQALFLLDRTD